MQTEEQKIDILEKKVKTAIQFFESIAGEACPENCQFCDEIRRRAQIAIKELLTN